ncbi:unnamed protein product [Psylliodes chrysocephalus]|uniref:Uncharacterized protein n=1 Tax=Psylliodes chrysocephalus TaxID=3402493 RepID=A0A9P0G3S5_9CUCU|nr:unnamed protein product [Psylliodes chrysocephala]
MTESSGPPQTGYETLYSRRVRDRIAASSKPAKVSVNINVSKKHAAILSPKVFKAKHIHPYKTVSTNKRKLTTTTNEGSATPLRKDPLAKNFTKKSSENELYQMRDTQTNTQTSEQTAESVSNSISQAGADPNTNRSQKSLEKIQETLEKPRPNQKSLENILQTSEKTRKSLEKAYDALTEPEDSYDSIDRDENSSVKSNSSLDESQENTDYVIRSDPNESLENLINTLEDSSDGLKSPENGSKTVLEMDEDSTGEGTPDTIKKSTHFSNSGKFVENLENFKSAYNTLPLPSKVYARTLNFLNNTE